MLLITIFSQRLIKALLTLAQADCMSEINKLIMRSWLYFKHTFICFTWELKKTISICKYKFRSERMILFTYYQVQWTTLLIQKNLSILCKHVFLMKITTWQYFVGYTNFEFVLFTKFSSVLVRKIHIARKHCTRRTFARSLSMSVSLKKSHRRYIFISALY